MLENYVGISHHLKRINQCFKEEMGEAHFLPIIQKRERAAATLANKYNNILFLDNNNPLLFFKWPERFNENELVFVKVM